METKSILCTRQIFKAKFMKVYCEHKTCIAGDVHGCGSKFWIVVSVAGNRKGKCQKPKVAENEEF